MTPDKTTKVVIALGLAALLVGASAVGYALYQQKQLRAQPIVNTPVVTSPIQPAQKTPPAVPSTGMKTLMGGGYSFQYPATWKVEDTNSADVAVYENIKVIPYGDGGGVSNFRVFTAAIMNDGPQIDPKLSNVTCTDGISTMQGEQKFTECPLVVDSNKDLVDIYAASICAVGKKCIVFVATTDKGVSDLEKIRAKYGATYRSIFDSFALNSKVNSVIIDTQDWKTYMNKTIGVRFKYPSDATLSREFQYGGDGINAVRTMSAERLTDLNFQVNYYKSLSVLGNYKTLDDYFKDRERDKVMTDRIAITFHSEDAWEYQDNGETSAYTILIPHADGSLHTISFFVRSSKAEVTLVENAMLDSVEFIQ